MTKGTDFEKTQLVNIAILQLCQKEHTVIQIAKEMFLNCMICFQIVNVIAKNKLFLLLDYFNKKVVAFRVKWPKLFEEHSPLGINFQNQWLM